MARSRLASLEMGDGQGSCRLDIAIEAVQELLGFLEAALSNPQLSQAHEGARTKRAVAETPDAARRRSAPRRLHPNVRPR